MVIPSTTEDFYRESEQRALEEIRFLQRSMAETARIREEYPGDWEIEELTRHIIFLGNQNIHSLMEVSEDARAACEKLN